MPNKTHVGQNMDLLKRFIPRGDEMAGECLICKSLNPRSFSHAFSQIAPEMYEDPRAACDIVSLGVWHVSLNDHHDPFCLEPLLAFVLILVFNYDWFCFSQNTSRTRPDIQVHAPTDYFVMIAMCWWLIYRAMSPESFPKQATTS